MFWSGLNVTVFFFKIIAAFMYYKNINIFSFSRVCEVAMVLLYIKILMILKIIIVLIGMTPNDKICFQTCIKIISG